MHDIRDALISGETKDEGFSKKKKKKKQDEKDLLWKYYYFNFKIYMFMWYLL